MSIQYTILYTCIKKLTNDVEATSLVSPKVPKRKKRLDYTYLYTASILYSWRVF